MSNRIIDHLSQSDLDFIRAIESNLPPDKQSPAGSKHSAFDEMMHLFCPSLFPHVDGIWSINDAPDV